MKKLLLALALWLTPMAALAQCNGVFPANTLCGNLTASPAPPSAFTASGTIIGPGTSIIGHFATWANTLGTQLADFNLYGAANTWSGTNNFTSTFQINGNTVTWPASTGTVPFLGTNNTWTGTNTFINTFTASGLITAQSLAASAIAEPTNLGLTSTIAGSWLTFNLVGTNGLAPSTTNPVVVPFRSTTTATGITSVVNITSVTSVSLPSGATLGTSNSIAFRLWVWLGLNAGTPELAVSTCSAQTVQTGNTGTTNIYPCAAWEQTTKTTSTVSAAATTAGVPYTVAAVANDSLRLIGFCDYASGLTSAGVYASNCTTLQLMGLGIKKPGDIVQTVAGFTNVAGSTTSTSLAQLSNNFTLSITPTSAPNLIHVTYFGTMGGSTTSQNTGFQVTRGTTGIGILSRNQISGSQQTSTPIAMEAWDQPPFGANTYQIYGETASGTVSLPPSGASNALHLEEIQG